MNICDFRQFESIRHHIYANQKMMQFIEDMEVTELESIPSGVYPTELALKKFSKDELLHTSFGYVHLLSLDENKRNFSITGEDLITKKNGYKIAQFKVSLKGNITIYFATAYKYVTIEDFTGVCDKIEKFDNPNEKILVLGYFEALTPQSCYPIEEERKYKVEYRSEGTHVSSFDLYVMQWIQHIEYIEAYKIYESIIGERPVSPEMIKKVKKFILASLNSMSDEQLISVSRYSSDMCASIYSVKDNFNDYQEWLEENKDELDYSYSSKRNVAFYGNADGYKFAVSRRTFIEDIMFYAFEESINDYSDEKIDSLSEEQLRKTFAGLLSYIYNNDITMNFIE